MLPPFPERGALVSPFGEDGCHRVCDAVGRGPRVGAEGTCEMERICDVPQASLESFSLLVLCGVTLSVAGDCRLSLDWSFPSPLPVVLVRLPPSSCPYPWVCFPLTSAEPWVTEECAVSAVPATNIMFVWVLPC